MGNNFSMAHQAHQIVLFYNRSKNFDITILNLRYDPILQVYSSLDCESHLSFKLEKVKDQMLMTIFLEDTQPWTKLTVEVVQDDIGQYRSKNPISPTSDSNPSIFQHLQHIKTINWIV